jgi:predicted ArsR family transcriptional regulator
VAFAYQAWSYGGSVRTDDQAPRTPLDTLSVLSERSRRRMFSFIRSERRAVTREEAAASVGISRKLAAFHLEKLVEAGLLRARVETSGDVRKVGRRPKVYECTGAAISVSIPERRHELLADLLLDAVLGHGDGESAEDTAVRTARHRGFALGEEAREVTRPGRLGSERGLTACAQMLDNHGFEPVREATGEVRLRNCPFHPLAAKAPGLVCAMNQAFIAGYLEGLKVSKVEAVLEPAPGECCVRLTAT